MLTAVIRMQWRYARWLMLFLSLLAFAAPVITSATAGGLDLRDQPVRDVLATFSIGGVALVPVALLSGLIAGIIGWTVDTNLGYVYLLVHPVPRWYMVLLRFTAGLLLLALPVAALLAGNLGVTLLGTPPEFIRAFPAGQAVRFAAVAVTMYGVMFGAAAIPTPARDENDAARRALFVIVGAVALLVLGVWLDQAVVGGSIGRWLEQWSVGPWSPLQLLFGRWGLYDV